MLLRIPSGCNTAMVPMTSPPPIDVTIRQGPFLAATFLLGLLGPPQGPVKRQGLVCGREVVGGGIVVSAEISGPAIVDQDATRGWGV
jgi:hypothetical protein